jgi:uncharacterized protein (UPF0261 family)
MSKKVVLVGSLDTKGKEYAFIKELIEKQNIETLVVDFGVQGNRLLNPISAAAKFLRLAVVISLT